MSITQTPTLATGFAESMEIPSARAKSTQRPPCADVPNNWDLDAGTPDAWRTAVRLCADCPLLTQCAQLAQSLTASGDGPRAMIWAGVAYDGAGKVVENLDSHRTTPLDHKRPMRIVRNGARPVCTEPVPTAPRRRIVLGRPLRPTGTDGI
ncbi:hypothetical protein [Nocardia sp. NPDC050710]|uniref:hypothetical protein n=1 Tax=Nocardia sp. NPDC050710 TaxID=3157220 RepID=UPI0033D1ADF2